MDLIQYHECEGVSFRLRHAIKQAPFYFTAGAAVCAPVSIAACQVLIGLAIVAMIAARAEWRIPPMWLPIAVFFALTLVSLAASGHAQQGIPQIKKFYVYALLFIVASNVGSLRQIRAITLLWILAAALSSAWALNQFYNRYEDAKDAHRDFYRAYIAHRITGFMSHWMTFSGEMMMVLLLIAALMFFSKAPWWLPAPAALIGIALILAETRSMWLGAAAGGVYLIWHWKRWVLLAIPVLAVILVLVNPFELGDRVRSTVQPHAGDLDSNAHRAMCRAIGYQMIKAHPLLGIGPEQVQYQYLDYLPPGTRLPLPTGFYGHLHNIYVHYAAELGIPAMLAMLWMLLRPLYDFLRGLRRGMGEGAWVLRAAAAVIIAIMVSGFFEKNIGDSEVLELFLAVIGCGYAVLMKDENAPPGRNRMARIFPGGK
ncbi:MAG TPA: O-antigen ligase family protein [Bryobacteraceae bacterium]|jgi:putative inorganic carbon (HCO3(-)) transporter|nr:O-antigen ligase family protein [Bryobacteraceae bacterium]